VLRVKTTGKGNGVYQTLDPMAIGPPDTAGVHVLVVKGQVGVGTGDRGDTLILTEKREWRWHQVKRQNSGVPAKQFVIFAAELENECGYAEFYVAVPSVLDDSTTNLLKNPELNLRYACSRSLSFKGEGGDHDSAADGWRIHHGVSGRTETEVLELPTAESEPLFVSEGNQGYVHAPSLTHATTAAILRSGYLSRCKTRDGNALAVNLSSQRVRLAQWLLDGVRQGQPLGALLGYRFERGLHENHPGKLLDRYILAFRKIAPAPGSEQERLATQVVDGLVLLRKWKAQQIPWESGLPGPAAQKEDYEACWNELMNLDDAVDAINDLVIAESIHQVAQGKAVRAGATLDAIALGEAPPPDLEVIRTPRSGIGITHRIAVIFSGPPATPAWGAETPRAKAEPCLNAWAATLLGPDAAGARCHVEYLDPGTDEAADQKNPRGQKFVSLSELRLHPIDLVYLPESEEKAQQSELEQRVAYYALQNRPTGVPADAKVRLKFVHDPSNSDWPPGAPGFAEILEAARTARRLITGARALAARDLALPERLVSGESEADAAGDSSLRLSQRAAVSVDAFKEKHILLKDRLWYDLRLMSVDRVTELPDGGHNLVIVALVGTALHIRLFNAEDQRVVDKSENELISGETLTALKKKLERSPLPDVSLLSQSETQQLIRDATSIAGYPAYPKFEPEAVRECLMELANFGISGAVPLSATEHELSPERRDVALEMLRTQAESVEREAAERVKRIQDLDAKYAANPSTAPVTTRDYHLARLRAVFGPEFRVLPHFVPDNAADLKAAFQVNEALQGDNRLAPVTWFQRVARVRDGAARLDAAMLYAEALGGAALGFIVGQLPYGPDPNDPSMKEPWVGLSVIPQGGRVSIVALAPSGIDPEKPLAGLLVDEWVETVPSARETTGVAFHFDSPQSRAPQSILLAVPPNNRAEWDLETLEATLLETLELAKLRAVDLTALAEVGQFLPALYFAHNQAGDTVSTDFKQAGAGG
jgi:hypothetical protein